MLLIIIILLVAYIVVPLLDLVIKDPPLYIIKVIIYVIALLYILWQLFGGPVKF